MHGMLRSLFFSGLAAVVISIAAGCGGSTAPNPNLQVPEMPPSTRGQSGGALKSDLSDPNKDAAAKNPEKK